MRVKIYKSITEIDEKGWDAIVGRNRIICTHRFLEAVEKSNINDCEYYYPVVYEGNRIIAHTCAYSISTELDICAQGLAKQLINSVRKVWRKFFIVKFLECGTPVALGSTVSFREGTNKEYILVLLVNALEKLAKDKGIELILIRDFYDYDIPFYDRLIGHGFKRLTSLPNTIIEVKWNTFDEYLKNLKSYYRCKIKKRIHIGKEKGLIMEIKDNFSSFSDVLHILWQNVYNHAKEYRREILTTEFFENMNKYLYGKSKVILLKVDSTVVGFGLILVFDDILTFLFTGLDYAFNRDYCVYFNLLYNVIELGIMEKKKEIHMGLTTYPPKSDVGAKIVNLYVYMKHLNPLLHAVSTFVFKIMTPQIKTDSKYIFKKME